ncbi:MAG: N-acetylmuramoyl-L-alanine amidase [Acidobacteriia bacterium]|nr:N-acetylmuramoyl-L-alanine amidase [Terriglobia bacterium]
MKLIAALAVSVSMLVAQTGRPALRSVTAVRHWCLADVTRVAIEVSGDFHFVTERLQNPERVYFDIPDARLRIDAKRTYAEQIDDKRLKRIRMAETLPGVTRIVLELGGSVDATSSQLTNPDRLIIELRSSPVVPALAEQPPALHNRLPHSIPLPPVGKVEPPKPDAPSPGKPQVKPPVKAETAPEPAAAEPSTAELAKTEAPGTSPLLPDPPKVTAVAPQLPTILPALPREGEVAKAARHTSTGETSLVRALGLKVTRVVIDPGHGGHDQGTQGAKGLLEKDLVLDVAKRVGKLIEDRMGAEVIYTRTDDSFVPLEGRTELANEKQASLFLSIHANSSPVTKIAGVETYYLNFTEAKDALDVASRENASSQKSIFELHDLIQTITLHDKAQESRDFAGRLQTSLYAFSAKNFPNTKNRGVKKAPFVVLIGATMPSVLAEIGFLSNPREEFLLKKADYRQKLADALFRGISRYADSLSHFQVAQAQK